MFDSGTALRKIVAQSDRFDFKNILKVFKVYEVLWISNVICITLFVFWVFLSLHTNLNNLRNQNTKKKENKVGNMQFLLLALSACFFNLL